MNTPELIEAAKEIARRLRVTSRQCAEPAGEALASAAADVQDLAAAIEASTQDDWQRHVEEMLAAYDAVRSLSHAEDKFDKDDFGATKIDLAEQELGNAMLSARLSLPNPPTAQPKFRTTYVAMSDDDLGSEVSITPAAQPDEGVEASYYERRHAERMKDPEFAAAFNKSKAELDKIVEANKPDEPCDNCQGTGHPMVMKDGGLGMRRSDKPCYKCRPDEQVCSTCGGRRVIEYINTRTTHIAHRRCPDCQPVPPSEGEVAAEIFTPRDFAGVVAEVEKNLRRIADELMPTDPATAVKITAHALSLQVANDLAANTPPDGHVAVYLPRKKVEQLADGDQDGFEDPNVYFEACRTALGVE